MTEAERSFVTMCNKKFSGCNQDGEGSNFRAATRRGSLPAFLSRALCDEWGIGPSRWQHLRDEQEPCRGLQCQVWESQCDCFRSESRDNV